MTINHVYFLDIRRCDALVYFISLFIFTMHFFVLEPDFKADLATQANLTDLLKYATTTTSLDVKQYTILSVLT